MPQIHSVESVVFCFFSFLDPTIKEPIVKSIPIAVATEPIS